MTRSCTLTLLFVLATSQSTAANDTTSSPNLVSNGDFELTSKPGTRPEGWQISGRGDIDQSLSLDAGHAGRHSAKLACTQFVGGTPDAHVMMCQVGQVGVEKGTWYRLSFWVKYQQIDCISLPRRFTYALHDSRRCGKSGPPRVNNDREQGSIRG